MEIMDGPSATNSPALPQDRFANVWKPLLLLVIPCAVAAMFSLSDPVAPSLASTTRRPSLVFHSYMVHEGEDPVPSQPLLTPFFTFHNKGSEPVTIRELVPACSSCVSPDVTAKEIPPGGEGRVIFNVKTRNQAAGFHEYLVTVKYTDPEPHEVVLTYKVVLPEKQIEVEPRVLMVMGRISSTDRDIITIADHRPERAESPMKILSVLSSSSMFTAQSAGQSVVEDVRREAIEVTYAGNIPVGQHRGVITVTTDDDMYPAIQIPVILGDRKRPADEQVLVGPEAGRIIVQSRSPEKSTGMRIVFTVPAKWVTSHVETFPTQIVAKVEKTEPLDADKIMVVVQISLSELPSKGIEQGILTLHAKDGEEAELVTVPITLLWR